MFIRLACQAYNSRRRNSCRSLKFLMLCLKDWMVLSQGESYLLRMELDFDISDKRLFINFIVLLIHSVWSIFEGGHGWCISKDSHLHSRNVARKKLLNSGHHPVGTQRLHPPIICLTNPETCLRRDMWWAFKFPVGEWAQRPAVLKIEFAVLLSQDRALTPLLQSLSFWISEMWSSREIAVPARVIVNIKRFVVRDELPSPQPS